MVKDSSFNSTSTDESDCVHDNYTLCNTLQCDITSSTDMVVKEEAREWTESHKSPTRLSPGLSSPNNIVSPITPLPSVTPVTVVTPVTSKLYSPANTSLHSSSFNHFRLTDSGLVPFEIMHTPLREAEKRLEQLKCRNCNKTFSTSTTFSLHKCFKYKCAECGFRSSAEETMFEHISQHREELYKCGICDEGFESPGVLEKHLSSIHDTPYNCSKCGLVFVKHGLYKAHCTTVCSNNAALLEQCGECGLDFDTAPQLKEHMISTHMVSHLTPSLASPLTSPGSVTSPSNFLTSPKSLAGFPGNLATAELSLSTQALLLKHSFLQKLVADLQNGLMKNQLPTKPLPRFPEASKCNLLNPTSTLFYPTALKPTLLKPEPLTSSPKPIASSPTFLGAEPNIKCNQCSASFSSFSDLHSHLLLHTMTTHDVTMTTRDVTMTTPALHPAPLSAGDMCGECETHFPDRVALEEHMRNTHDSERPYKCSHCDKTFTRSNNLQEHLRTHTGSRPYVCNYCEKSFARSSILHIHMRTHTKIKPFQCSVCPAAFSHSNSLQAHLRRHTGAKPYVCPVCSKAFRQSGTLHRHIRTHNKTKRSEAGPRDKLTKVELAGNFSPASYTGALTMKLLQELAPLSSFTTSPSTLLNKENQPDIKQSLQMLHQLQHQQQI